MLDLAYTPEIVVDTAGLENKVWLGYRRKGVGGADTAILFGISKWLSLIELYYDKLGFESKPIISAKANAERKFRLDAGHVLEPLVRDYYATITGFKVINDTNMYRHPLYPWMIADVDFVAYTDEGVKIGGEVKNSDLANIGLWQEGVIGKGGRMPLSYEYQVRHYMAVMNLDRWDVICCFDALSASKFFVVTVYRDLVFEEALIEGEKDFWLNHVQARVAPTGNSISNDAIKRLRSMLDTSVVVAKDKTPIELPKNMRETAAEYIELYEEKSRYASKIKQIEERLNALSLPFTTILGNSEKGTIPVGDGENQYEISYSPQERIGIDREKLSITHPDVYEECATKTSFRPFSIKVKKVKKK